MKRFSKKMVALLLGATMVASLMVGCGKDTTTNTPNNSTMETNDETSEDSNNDNVDSSTKDLTSGPVDVSKFTLDGKEYSLPMTFDEMEKISPLSDEIPIYTPVMSSYVPIETFGEDEKDFELENGLKVGFSNTSDSEQEVSKCQNTLIRVTKDMDIQMEVNGITIGSTIDDVLKAFPVYQDDMGLEDGLKFSYVNNENSHYTIDYDNGFENAWNDDYTKYNDNVLENESLFNAEYYNDDNGNCKVYDFIIENGIVVEIIASYTMMQ